MLEATGERLIPDQQRGELVHAEHLARYRFAASLVEDRRVLDVACGEGYGTAMLAGAGATSAIGVDLDDASVEHAKARYGLDFQSADVTRLPFEDESFDLVVSFETIEHVKDPEAMLAELRRVLTPSGLLVISTPNNDEYLIDNEFHVHEYESAEFTELLRRHFDAVHVVFQQNWLASAILSEPGFAADGVDHPLDADFYKTVGEKPGRELYTIAVCGDGDRSALREVAVATGVYEAHRLAQWHARATEAERLVGEWHARATKAEELLDDANDTLARITASVSWRMTAPLRRLKNRPQGRRNG